MDILADRPFFLLNRLHRETAGAARRAPTVATFVPPVDIREESTRFVIEADLPGVTHDAIEITADQGVLTLQGERKARDPGATERRELQERTTGRFLRRFTLPDNVQCDGIRARFNQGVLEISVPKQAEVTPRKVPVDAA